MEAIISFFENPNYHAILMFSIWFILVPIGIISIRYFKPKPTQKGILKLIKLTNIQWLWFNIHKYILYLAVFLSLCGTMIALSANGGFTGSIHSIFGLLSVTFGCLQIISSLLRGTHGGKYYNNADLNKPASWNGDHYNMTPRRKWFESNHKIGGYFAAIFAIASFSSGLMQFEIPYLLYLFIAVVIFSLILCVLFEYKGMRYDTYKSVFGFDKDHPHNKTRKEL